MRKGDRVRVKGICGTGWTMARKNDIGYIVSVSSDGKRAAVEFYDGEVCSGNTDGLELRTHEDSL